MQEYIRSLSLQNVNGWTHTVCGYCWVPIWCIGSQKTHWKDKCHHGQRPRTVSIFAPKSQIESSLLSRRDAVSVLMLHLILGSKKIIYFMRLSEFRGRRLCVVVWAVISYSSWNVTDLKPVQSCGLGQDIGWILGDTAWVAGQLRHNQFFSPYHKRPQIMSASKYLLFTRQNAEQVTFKINK